MIAIIKEDFSNKGDFIIQGESGLIYKICEGTGDNLLPEDVEEGYVDYIYYSVYESLIDLIEDEEYDGGMVLLKTYYQETGIEHIIKCVEYQCDDKLIYSKKKFEIGDDIVEVENV